MSQQISLQVRRDDKCWNDGRNDSLQEEQDSAGIGCRGFVELEKNGVGQVLND